MINTSYIPAIIQAISEALPLSSSLHMNIIGIKNSTQLDTVTAIAGLFCIIITGKLFAFIITLSRTILQLISNILELNWQQVFELIITIIICISIVSYKKILCINIDINIMILLSVISGALLYISDSAKEEAREVNYSKFIVKHLLISIACNTLAVISGMSRLGTVYSGLRITGLTRQEAFSIAITQGILLHIYTIFQFIIYMKNSQTFTQILNFSNILCMIIYAIITLFLLKASSNRLRTVILLIVLYRVTILPFMYINFY